MATSRKSQLSKRLKFIEEGMAASCGALLPQKVEDTDDYGDSAVGAEELWAKGFRPIHAHDLKHHDQVAYVETMFGVNTPKWGVTTVEEVGNDGYGTTIVSTWERGTVNVDECSEVWVKRGW